MTIEPACKNCIFWAPPGSHTSDTWGLCDSQRHVRYRDSHPTHSPGMTTDCGENTIATDPDFYCRDFEPAKEESK